MVRTLLASFVCALLAGGCSVIVEDTLQNKQGTRDGSVDTGMPTGPRCSTTEDCLIIPDRIVDCTQQCVGASPGTLGVCVTDHPDLTPAGTPCGDSDGARICVDGECRTRECGDGYVDREAMPPEYCDDGDENDVNMCNNSCTRPCVPPATSNCSDDNVCNGAETCDTAAGICRGARPLADGTDCRTAASVPGTCQAGVCVPAED